MKAGVTTIKVVSNKWARKKHQTSYSTLQLQNLYVTKVT